MELDDSLYWVALAVTAGLASRLTPEAVFRATLTELEACHLPAPVAQTIASRAPLKAAEEEVAELKKLGRHLLNWEETEYPRRLKEIYDPPPLLYVRGDVNILARHSLVMVGTRRPTTYGNQMAERLAQDLAERGLVIVSGLARGIDSSAHKGACAAARGVAVGVLGNGIDII